MKHEDSQHLIKDIIEQVNQLHGEKFNSFGQNSKTPSLTSTGHNEIRYLYSHPQTNTQNHYIKDYQSSNHSQRQSRDIQQIQENIDEIIESDNKQHYQVHQTPKLNSNPIYDQGRKQRQYQRMIKDLEYQLEEKIENQEYRMEGIRQLKQDNSRLSVENVRLKKQILGQQFQIKMIQTQINTLRQDDNSNRLRQQIKIRQEYHRKQLRQKDEQREVQVDRIVKLFENYNQDLEMHYKGIIQDNQIIVSENVQDTLYSLKRTFNRNKNREIDRIGMQYITTEIYQTTRIKSKSKYQNPITNQIEDNSNQVIQKVKQQLISLNRLKEKQIEEMRNVKDNKLSYLDTETAYQKMYLGLIVDLESLRYNKIHKSSLEEHAEIIQLKSEIKILNQELGVMKKFGESIGGSRESKLQKELDIMKEYIKEENESKIKFFTDLQKTKTSNQQIYSQNTRLKKQIENLRNNNQSINRNTKNSHDYDILNQEYKELKQELQHKTTRIIQQERQIRTLSQNNGVNQLKELQDELKSKELDQLKLFSQIQSLQNEISKLKIQKEEYLDVIRRIGANIETEHELKIMLSNLEKQNIHLKSQNLMLRESMTQQNIARATNEACRMITQRYQRQIHGLRIAIDKGKQEFANVQKINGQLVQDLRVVNQHAKVRGVAVEHLWEVKNAEYQNIIGQIKRLQSL